MDKVRKSPAGQGRAKPLFRRFDNVLASIFGKPIQKGQASSGGKGKEQTSKAKGNCERTDPKAEPKNTSREFKFNDPEPWPEPVHGVELLDNLVAVIKHYLALPEGAAEAMALWVLFTHIFEAVDVSPRLALTSPILGCGKTTALSILTHLVNRPLPASNWTPATVFRSIEKKRPTLLIDEADTFLEDRDGLRGILNSGHTREMAYVMRSVGEEHEPRQFSTWAPMVMAKIGRFPPTLEDRSIVIQMQRRRPDEKLERFRSDCTNDLEALARQAARWAADNLDDLREADPDMPGKLYNRAADNWRPLLAVADQVGGHWPKTARWTALRLSESSDEPSTQVMMLAKIRALFDERGVNRLSSEELSKEVSHSKNQLARHLRPFGIRPHSVRINKSKTPKGYYLTDFEDAFARYLPPESATPQQSNEINDFEASPAATRPVNVAAE